MITATALEGLPEVRPGDDLASLITTALAPHALTAAEAGAGAAAGAGAGAGGVLVIAHKVVSKSEGRIRHLSQVEPTERAIALATEQGKDPRHVQVVLDESREVIRADHGVLICVTHHGFVCANAGVDASNVPGEDTVLMLPRDPDASARSLRARIPGRPAVIITDSFGRAWRHGQVDVAIGCAGIHPLEDWRGSRDALGRELKATWIAITDELAAAADLARTKDGYQPVTLIRGAERHVTDDDGPGAQALIRPESEDLFR